MQIPDAERSVCSCSSMVNINNNNNIKCYIIYIYYFSCLKELGTMSDHLKAQLGYYRNTELRAEQKHLAELKNLEVQHQILELELKTKQKQYDTI